MPVHFVVLSKFGLYLYLCRFQGGSGEDADDDEVPAERVSPGSCWPDG